MRVGTWLLAAASVLLMLLYVANVPFYSGSSVGSRLNWRMEHGRLRVQCRQVNYPESFYIAINSEGLKFVPEWRVQAWGNWDVNVPLWIPLGVCILGSAGLFVVTRKRQPPGVCGQCGYDTTGLVAGAKCPECGEREVTRH